MALGLSKVFHALPLYMNPAVQVKSLLNKLGPWILSVVAKRMIGITNLNWHLVSGLK